MKCIKFWSQLLFILSVSNYISVNAQNKLPTGAIKGKVVDMDSKTSLIGVNVVLIDTPWGSATDTDGNFIIENIPVGNYLIKFSYFLFIGEQHRFNHVGKIETIDMYHYWK